MSINSSDSAPEITGNELDILGLLIGDDEEKWRNTKGEMEIINQFVQNGDSPLEILKNYYKMDIKDLPSESLELWSIIFHLVMEGPHRKRLESFNTFQQAIDIIKEKKNIVVLTGAGISVPCGVPDFRSRNGIYSRLSVDFPDLDEPQSMFDIKYFVKNPRPFFKFAKEIYPGNFSPSLGHRFIKLMEDKGKLLRNYSQNIDTIEMIAGIKKVIQCHGSFATATCMRCQHRVNGDDIKTSIMEHEIPICTVCTGPEERSFDSISEKWQLNSDSLKKTDGEDEEDVEAQVRPLMPIMKPDIVFFGEGLPKDFHATLAEDKDSVDLLIVIGSSLKVRPVAHIPSCLPSSVPQILINKEPLSNHSFDVELLGDCDVIVTELCRQLGWSKELGKEAEWKFEEKALVDMGAEIDAAKFGMDNEEDLDELKNEEDTKEMKNGEDKEETSDIDNKDEIKKEDVVEVEIQNGVNMIGEQSKEMKNGENTPPDCVEEGADDKKEDPNMSNSSIQIVGVADLLSEGVSMIRVPPNRYVFCGAEYFVNAANLEEPFQLSLNIPSDSNDSSSSLESSSSSGNDDNDEKMGLEEDQLYKQVPQSATDGVGKKRPVSSEEDCLLDLSTSTKKSKMSSSNKGHSSVNGVE